MWGRAGFCSHPDTGTECCWGVGWHEAGQSQQRDREETPRMQVPRPPPRPLSVCDCDRRLGALFSCLPCHPGLRGLAPPCAGHPAACSRPALAAPLPACCPNRCSLPGDPAWESEAALVEGLASSLVDGTPRYSGMPAAARVTPDPCLASPRPVCRPYLVPGCCWWPLAGCPAAGRRGEAAPVPGS